MVGVAVVCQFTFLSVGQVVVGVLMRQVIGTGTPREAAARGPDGLFLFIAPQGAFLVAILTLENTLFGFIALFLDGE